MSQFYHRNYTLYKKFVNSHVHLDLLFDSEIMIIVMRYLDSLIPCSYIIYKNKCLE